MQHAHKGAVYLHRGQGFVVESLNLDLKRAELQALETDYYTTPIVQSVINQNVEVQRTVIRSHGEGVPGSTGARFQREYTVSLVGVSVTSSVIGFRRKTLDGDHVLSVEALELPPTTFDTLAVRFDLPTPDAEEDMESHLGAIHGLEHALLAVAPLIGGCDRGDLGSAWYAAFPNFGYHEIRAPNQASGFGPAVFVYDQTPGGVGLCEKLYANLGRWVMAGVGLLSTCQCTDGCPACLLSSRCESNNEHLSKSGSAILLNDLSP